MKLGKYFVLVGLSLIVACGKPPESLTVTLTSSELNPAFNSSVTFTATATPASKIVKLELLEGTTVKKTVNNAANLEQNIVMNIAGKRSFTARVTDSAGVVASSAVVEVNTKAPPVVTLTAFPNTIAVNTTSVLIASVVSNNGIKEVEFFEGTKSLGKDLVSPFEMPVNDFVSSGLREFKAVATDNFGLIGQAGASVTVVSSSLPFVTLKASLKEVFVDGLSTLTASVVASSGVSEVEFFEGTKSLGKDSSVPFELVVTDFTSVGSRVFKAVATDNNGLKGEALTSIAVLASKPTSFKLFADKFLVRSGTVTLNLSPDVLELEVKYEVGTVSKQTTWTLTVLDSNIDGDFGTIVAVPGDPNGLRSSKVRYVPPAFPDFDGFINILIEAKSVQDPNQTARALFPVRKKGTQTGIILVTSPANASPKLNVPISINIRTVDQVGIVKNQGIWNFPDSSSGTLSCDPSVDCFFTEQGEIVSPRVLFTPLKLGAVSITANSLHDGAFAKLDLTVVP